MSFVLVGVNRSDEDVNDAFTYRVANGFAQFVWRENANRSRFLSIMLVGSRFE